MTKQLSVLVLAVTWMIGCAPPVADLAAEEEKGETNSELAGNATEDNADAEVVGILFAENGEQEAGHLCTGSLIAPRVVLTAGHCTLNGTSGEVFVGTTAATATEAAEITTFIPHPSYNPQTLANDIGIVVLAKPLTTIRTLAVNRTPFEQLIDVTAGQPTIKMVGYGATSRDAKGNTTGVGTKRVGLTLMKSFTATTFFVSAATNIGGSTACGGDSGGPAFINTTRGWLLIGTESNGDTACQVGTNKMRVDACLDFIDAVVAQVR